MQKDLDRIEELLTQASPLPWRVEKLDSYHPGNASWAEKVRIIKAGSENSKDAINIAESGVDGELRNSKPEEDIELAVLAVNAIGKLIETNKRLIEELEALKNKQPDDHTNQEWAR